MFLGVAEPFFAALPFSVKAAQLAVERIEVVFEEFDLAQNLVIDLKTRVLSEKMQVHLVRPGARYNLMGVVQSQGVLPADAPFLMVEDGKDVPTASKIAPMLERARVLRSWSTAAKSKRPPMMTTDIDHYRLGLQDASSARMRTMIRNSAHQLLWKIPGGTLVVIPGSYLGADAIMAEIYSRHQPRRTVWGEDENKKLQYLARELRGMKRAPMRDLPVSVTDAAKTVRVVSKISGHAEDRILRMYYGDYQRAEENVAELVGGSADFGAAVLGRMIDLHMSITHFLDTGQSLKPGQALYSAPITAEPKFHARVDSPDGRTYLGSNKIATFALKLLLIVAASGVEPSEAASLIAQNCLQVTNSVTGDTVGLVEATRGALVDFTTTSGYDCVADYVRALQEGLNANQASISGSAKIEE